MKKTLLATALACVCATASAADNHKVGVLLSFTGPIESLTPDMAGSAEMAFQEANDSGLLLGGATLEPVRGDATCVDSAAGTAAAERLITSDNVVAIMGADCSGVTTAVANNTGVPNGVVMVSPSATSPALSTIDDKGLFFRTAPSDARQGELLADILIKRGMKSVAVTYTNNDYGKGLADSFSTIYEALGGKVEITAAHEDGKADYSAEVAALSASGAEHLAVFGYVDQGGKGIVQAAIDTDAFQSFVFGDGMIGESILESVGSDLDGSVIGTVSGSDSSDAMMFNDLAKATGVTGDGPYRGESYDAAALIVLAIQAGGSADRASIQANIMNVANAPGEEIGPGELFKALKILADGGEVNYQGATSIELNDVGETKGSYKELEVEGGKFKTVQVH